MRLGHEHWARTSVPCRNHVHLIDHLGVRPDMDCSCRGSFHDAEEIAIVNESVRMGLSPVWNRHERLVDNVSSSCSKVHLEQKLRAFALRKTCLCLLRNFGILQLCRLCLRSPSFEA